MGLRTKSVDRTEFLRVVRAHEKIAGTNANVIYDHDSDLSVWSVKSVTVGYTRGSVSQLDYKFDAYLANGVDPGYMERVKEAVEYDRHDWR